jgi:predicted nucleic acid-binding Zn ribbon protein
LGEGEEGGRRDHFRKSSIIQVKERRRRRNFRLIIIYLEARVVT